MDWRQTASHRFQKATLCFQAEGEADLQESIEHLDETLVVAFKGFLTESGTETGKRTLFSALVESMAQQPEFTLSGPMQKFCFDIHDARNRSRYDGSVPEKKFVLQSLGFVRNRLTELDVQIPQNVALGYDPLGRRRKQTARKAAASRPASQTKVMRKAWVRVNDLCRELEVKAKRVVAAITEMGLHDRASQASWIDRATADRLRERFRPKKKSASGRATR